MKNTLQNIVVSFAILLLFIPAWNSLPPSPWVFFAGAFTVFSVGIVRDWITDNR